MTSLVQKADTHNIIVVAEKLSSTGVLDNFFAVWLPKILKFGNIASVVSQQTNNKGNKQ